MNLQSRFQNLWNRCQVHHGDTTSPDRSVGESDSVFLELIDYYSESHRHYHTVEHVQKCLNQLDLAIHEIKDRDAVEMAIWFHDVIYEIDGKENELQSAAYFLEQSDQIMTPEFRQRVHDMILTTVHDKNIPKGDACYVVDVDLSSLGMPWECFRKDSDDVRKEKGKLSDEEFLASQRPFLQALLDRPSIFFTEFYGKLYESTARTNIQRQLDSYH